MKKYNFSKSTLLNCGIEELFEFHRDTSNLEKVSPQNLDVKIIKMDEVPMEQGSEVELKISKFGIGIKWKIKILHLEPPNLISDLQEKGPFKHWLHNHRFEKTERGTLMTDEIFFMPPLGVLGIPLVPFIKLNLNNMFEYRHKRMKEIFGNEK